MGRGYGPLSDAAGAAFWLLAIAMFTSPFWLPIAAFVAGLLVW